MVKECTGHRSDAVDKYQITSEEQQQKLSKIIANEHVSNLDEVQDVVLEEEKQLNVVESSIVTVEGADKNAEVTVKSNDVGDLTSGIVNVMKSKGKSTIKIQIEIINE